MLSFRTRGHAAAFLKFYLVGGVILMLVGFVLYSQLILRRLEEDNRDLIRPLARLSSYVASIADRETSLVIRDVIDGITTYGRIRFVITDEEGNPLFARGLRHRSIERKLQNDEPLTPEERRELDATIARMKQAQREAIPIEYVSRDRRIIGHIYYGDVDPSELAEIPLVVTDVEDRPIAWRIYGPWQTVETHPGNVRRAEGLIRDAQRYGRKKELQINPVPRQGVFYYELRPLTALQWMPYVQMLLVGLFILGGVRLYRRIQADEQAAIWAGLAKESAHQLGTPISSLMGWVDLAKEIQSEAALGSQGPDLYAEMTADLKRLQRIVARFAQVGTEPTLTPLDVNEVVAEAVRYFRKRLPTRSTPVEILEDYGEVPEVLGNEDLLQWVIENLIRNALDAIEERGIEKGRIELATRYDSRRDCVTIRVRDNGGGIPRAARRRIFAPGFTTKKHGWGVGLALVRRIVEAYHDGRIRLVETNTTGTTFEVQLPALSSEARRERRRRVARHVTE